MKEKAPNTGTVISVVIPEGLQGRLDKVLTELFQVQMPALSRVRLTSLIDQGHLKMGETVVKSVNKITKGNQQFTLFLPPPERAAPAAQTISLSIVFEDEHLLVINKPAGMVVHPAPGNRDGTMVNALLAHCGDSLSGIGGVARPGIVHRLDKDTTGLIVVAKTDVAHKALSLQFADRTLNRTYLAVVWGHFEVLAGEVDAPIGRHLRDRKKMAVSGKGKQALTRYRVLEEFVQSTLLECKLSTGRTHQIRVHLAHLKRPVVGDNTYGKQIAVLPEHKKATRLTTFPRQALHATEIQFRHPITSKLMRFKAPPPKDLKDLLAWLRKEAKTLAG